VGRWIVALLAASAVAAASASGTSTPVVTLRDSGKTFTVRTGRELTLRLTERYRWTGPRVRGNAVRLTPVDYFRDPGYLEWSIDALAHGTARIAATGYAESGTRGCDPGPCSPRLFRVTIVVR
jgi:predicted secreted protein